MTANEMLHHGGIMGPCVWMCAVLDGPECDAPLSLKCRFCSENEKLLSAHFKTRQRMQLQVEDFIF